MSPDSDGREASGGVAVIVLEESAEPLVALHLAGRKRQEPRFARVVGCGNRERNVTAGLVRTFEVVVLGVLGEQVPEVALAEDQEVIQAFGFSALPPAFGDRIPVRDQMHHIQTIATERSG